MSNTIKPLSELKSVRGISVIVTDGNVDTHTGKTIFRYDGDVYLVKVEGYAEFRIGGEYLERA